MLEFLREGSKRSEGESSAAHSIHDLRHSCARLPLAQRVRGGVLADGLNSIVAAVFNSLPNTTFAQNNEMVPGALAQLPVAWHPIVGSPLIVGTMTALILNLVIPPESEEDGR